MVELAVAAQRRMGGNGSSSSPVPLGDRLFFKCSTRSHDRHPSLFWRRQGAFLACVPDIHRTRTGPLPEYSYSGAEH